MSRPIACHTCGVLASVSYVIRDRRFPFKEGANTYYCLKCAPEEVLNETPSEILKTAKAINEMEKWKVTLAGDLVDRAWLDAANSVAENDKNNSEENWEMLSSQKPEMDQKADARGAELAFAQVMGMEAHPFVGTFGGPDVGEIYQVKQTMVLNGHLRIPCKQRNRQKNHCFILAIGELPKFKIKGWIHAQEGMKPKFLKQFEVKNRCWWVPQWALHPMDSLPLPPDYTSVDLPEGLVFIPEKNRNKAKETNESNTDIN